MLNRRPSCLAIALILSIVLASSVTVWQPAQATVYTWDSSNAIDSWHDAANWAPAGGPPTASDDGDIHNGNTAHITADASATYARIHNGGIIQDGGNVTPMLIFCGLSGTGTYVLNDGNLVTSWLTVSQAAGAGDFTMNGGSMTAQRIWLGNNSSEATFHMNGGSLTVTGDFQIADHDWTDVKSTFTQTGGAVSATSGVTMTLGDTADENGWAKYELLGGTLTLENPSTPFTFSANPAPIYFEFEYGNPTSAALILNGVWDYASVTSIPNADFRVHGAPATPSTLLSIAGTGALDGYTIFYGVPEPSTLLLAAVALACAALLRRRR